MAIEIGKMLRELPDHEKKEAQARAIRARDEYKEAVAVQDDRGVQGVSEVSQRVEGQEILPKDR